MRRYRLEKYNGNNRYTCPQCGRPKCFVRYIDTFTGGYVAPDVGKCGFEILCGYHKTPRQDFMERKKFADDTADKAAYQRPRDNEVSV